MKILDKTVEFELSKEDIRKFVHDSLFDDTSYRLCEIAESSENEDSHRAALEVTTLERVFWKENKLIVVTT